MSPEDAEEYTQAHALIGGGWWRSIELGKRLGVPDALSLSVEAWVQRLGGYVKQSVPDRREAVRNLTAEEYSTREIGKILGVSHETVASDVRNLTASDTRTAHEKIAKFAFDRPAAAILGEAIKLGDFYQLSSQLGTDSADLIFTDPPYDDESIPLFERMGEVAARVLKPGGSLITYCGHRQIFAAGEMLSKYLRFWQPLCCLHATPPFARLTEYGVIARFKPMLWFVKGTRSDKQTFVENVVSSAREKDFHPWQQGEGDAEYFIGLLSPVGGLVVDFFAGGGTTIVAARRLGRIGLGFEIDLKHFTSAMKRIDGGHDAEQAA
jgi:hypothetical protein